MPPDASLSIADLADHLGRAEHTIRRWVNEEALPADLMPSREGGRQKLLWSPSQLLGLERFARDREQRRGWQHSPPEA